MVQSLNIKPLVPLRAPTDVMRLKRMGASFQTRISFARRLIRRMNLEKWSVERTLFDVNYDGFGTAIFPYLIYLILCQSDSPLVLY